MKGLPTCCLMTSLAVAALFLALGGVTAEDMEDASLLRAEDILLRLFEQTQGYGWNVHTNWVQNNDVCLYYGISCYPDDYFDQRRRGHIQKIDLSDNHLVGTMPGEVFSLPFIESIVLRDNANLDVKFDSIADAQFLKELVLSDTVVKSLSGIEKAAPVLEVLHITNLELGGAFPWQIYQLVNLRELYANFNSFTGPLSDDIGNLAQLEALFLYENELSGQIPASIGKLRKLKTLSLGQNAFSGTLPPELGECTDLEILAIHRAKGSEKGRGIQGSLPSLAHLGSITEVHLQNQGLSGEIPADFLMDASETKVIKVDLSSNEISGSIPESLVEKKRMYLFLEGNNMDPLNTSFCNRVGGWMGGNVGSIGCDALLCPPKTYALEGRATGSISCEPCETAEYAGSTSCAPVDGASVNERAVLINLYNVMGGQYWQSATNWLNPSVSVCQWQGISCTADSVSGINLRNNGLTKAPPRDLFSLPNLRVLDLSLNAIDFNFGDAVFASLLEVLDLSQCDVQSLDGIASLALTNIRKLSVASNYLDQLPADIFALTSLEELDISHNRFTGSLSGNIGFLSNLVRLKCFGNSFSGQFPPEIGNLVKLEELLCAENSFTGVLPDELNNLSQIQKLSLHQTTSSSGIGGNLPAFTGLQQLVSLQLDGNFLEGSLPEDFLANTRRGNDQVELLLGDNMLSGVVPSAWGSRFSRLFLDLTGNKITGIGEGICNKRDWMSGGVGAWSCDAILCERGTFNEFGRRSGESDCRSCPEAQFMGSKQCGGEMVDGDVEILKELYSSTHGNNWVSKDGWATSNDYCVWHGIGCNAAGRVVSIDLESNGLTGTPSPSVFRLSALKELNLGKNGIAFSFEGIEAAKNLVTLNLSGTNLGSVTGIQGAQSLSELHLTDNDLQGSFPEELLLLTNLRFLFLNFNQLEGRIPAGISSLQNLEELYLFHNRLGGELPASLGSLNKLRVLSLSENNFQGNLPKEIEELTSLEILAIQREGGVNSLVEGSVGVNQGISEDAGPGLTGPLLSFSRLKSLKELYLGMNSLSGPIPSNFLDGIDDKTDPVVVDLISNKLTGDLPSSLARFDRMTLYVAGNEISEIPHALCRRDNWMGGDVASYLCDGILCPPNTFNSEFGRKSDSSGCEDCPSGSSSPYFGSFSCQSSDDEVVAEQRAILEEFYEATSGDSWKHHDNWMDSDESVCDWYGVNCSPDGVVESIHLMNNGLQGKVPRSLYGLTGLREIDLSGNNIKIFFDGIQKAQKLEYLNLDSTGLRSLEGIESAGKLKDLHIVDNDFGGQFPEQIFSLSSLEVLYMSENSVGDTLPATFKNLASLVSLSCSLCGLSGNMPTFLGFLTNLEYLELDRNHFFGKIPTEIQSLIKLKRLDLSKQFPPGQVAVGVENDLSSGIETGLSGPLPSFANFTQLSELYLQQNLLSSDIPFDFLEKTDASVQVTVDLQSNSISGTIPSGLSRIQKLNLYLSENMISGVPSSLCSLTWNDKESSSNSCDFILCPPGSMNGLGRSVSGLPCEICPGAGDAPFFGATSCGQDLEKDILDELYRDLGGEQWINADGWSSGGDICSRYGVTCENGFVRRLDLHDNNLHGTVSPRIWLLTKMSELNLSQNKISVPFEKIADASSLKILRLSQTSISSIENIGGALSLEELRLSNCGLEGRIPDELFLLVNLKRLVLSYNRFSGTLSSLIGNIRFLEELYLNNNMLGGSLPENLFRLIKIRVLSLGENKFVGEIPYQVSFLPFLETLNLQAEGVEPDSPFVVVDGIKGDLPSFHANPRLRELFLSHNLLGGTIPNNFLAGVLDKTITMRVDLFQNGIEGALPETLSAFDDLFLNIGGNRISSIPSRVCSKTDWMEGLLATGCDALLCDPGYYNEYGRRIESENCVKCDHEGVALYYGSTKCGPIAPDYMEPREILEEFYRGLAGPFWDDNTNWMDNNAPLCTWKGVYCEKNAFDEDVITKISLPSNNLKGFMPSIVFYLKHLKILNVAGNEIGMTFRDVVNAQSLEELRVGSTELKSLEGIKAAGNLKVLQMDHTSFEGQQISTELFELTSLVSLDISKCGFVGSLSSGIGRLSNLKDLTCANNDLEGEIPEVIGNLSNLRTLALSNNNFYGRLPQGIEDLTFMETLQIDARSRRTAGLSGPLPSFANMPNLKYLDLGSNSITGPIPSDFLSSVQTNGPRIRVNLDANMITGEVPSQLSRFERLDIDLSDNEVVSIGEGLCERPLWWDGDLEKYGCRGLLCPAGTFSEIGRHSSSGVRCDTCPGETSPYLGRTSCPVLKKAQAKEILKSLYLATGGPNWKNNDGWMNENLDICFWYGITCANEFEIESVILGSNNLVGRPPKEIFELPGLRFLWLYSNPMDFSFDGIEKANTLMSLQLDSTMLSSLDGIGDAPALVDLDVRFTALTGALTPEIAELDLLETFLASDNSLSGTLPSFSSNRKLTILRLAGNDFSGLIPEFATHPDLKTIDLSSNRISGEIPINFLEATDTSMPIFVDLSSNQISGSIPGSLGRFAEMTIYLRNNRFSGIHPDLCKMSLWNGGDVGLYGCDGILCPSRFSSSTGRASDGKTNCSPCPDAEWFGSTACSDSVEGTTHKGSGAADRRPRFTLVVQALLIASVLL